MKDILNRLKSPIVIAQIMSIISTIICAVTPNMQDSIEKVTYSLTIIVNVFAGLNNPTDRDNF